MMVHMEIARAIVSDAKTTLPLGKKGRVVVQRGTGGKWNDVTSDKWIVFYDMNIKPKDQKGAHLVASDCTREEADRIALPFSIAVLAGEVR